MKTQGLLVAALTIASVTSITTTSVAASASVLTPLSAASNLLPRTVQEVLSKSLSMQGTDPHRGTTLEVFLAPSKENESPIYFIRLPPTAPYYSKLKLYKKKIGKRVPMNFTLNGRPHKVYHWNLPHRRAQEQRRRLLQQFHPFNHRSPTQAYRAFITQQEAAVPKPPTALALPVLAGSQPGGTDAEPRDDGSQPALGGEAGARADTSGETGAGVHQLPRAGAKNSMDYRKKLKTKFMKKMFSPEKSTFVELDFPEDESSLQAGANVQSKNEKSHLGLGIFSAKSQEKSQETFFFDNTQKKSDKIPPEGEEKFSQSDGSFEDEEHVLSDKRFTKAIKSRAQKVSWAN